MKKILLSATACLTMAVTSNAQEIQPCGTYQARESHLKNVPGYAAKLNAAEAAASAEYQAFLQNSSLAAKSSTIDPNKVFTVPVVFHVLHLGESVGSGTNVSDALLISALAQVNKDYARTSSDTNTIDPLYKSLYVDAKMRFVLAKKDPQGNCTNGIVRHYNPKTNWSQSDLFNYQYSTMAAGSWNPTKYLNIYIVKNIIDDGGSAGIIVGYTYLPGTSPILPADAIVYRYDFLSGLNSRSLSHEIGHWFGLSHTFGGSNNAGVSCGNDDIFDTPRTSGFFSTCPSYASLSDSCDIGKVPNINNIMDYSGCPKMFTQGQVDKMRLTLSSSIAQRDSLAGIANLIFTGVLDVNGNPTGPTPCAPIADFASNKSVSCAGQAILFKSTSYNSTPTSYSWVFEGGTPATSTSSTQSVIYSTPGTHSVSLTVSNANGSSTKTVNSLISTSWNSSVKSLPYLQGFESGIVWPEGWSHTNADAGTPSWELSNYGGYDNSSKSLILPNANYPGFYSANIDYIETPTFDFSNVTGISISFDYSFARKTAVTTDTFKLQYSLDCGGSWVNVSGSPTALTMALTGGTVNAPYIPWSSITPNPKWVTKTIPSISLSALNNKRDVRFRFWFQNDIATGTSQNLYIDNINIGGTVGLYEFENSLGLSIYPNPTSSSSTVEFTSPSSSKVNVLVYDVTGRVVEQSSLNVTAGINSKYTVNSSNNLNAGIYFITLNIDNKKVTKKLIIE